MQHIKRKAPIGLAAGIGARTTHNITERTAMNTSTHRKAPATKAKLSAVTNDFASLTLAESKMLSAARKLDEYDFDFIVRLMQIHAHDNPARAIVKGKPEFVLIHGGAA